MLMSMENPYEAPASEIRESLEIGGAPGPHNYASLGDRFLGSFIDGVINISIFLGVLYLTGLAMIADSGDDADFWEIVGHENIMVDTLAYILSILIYIAVQWPFWSASSQSIGKKVMKTQIVNFDGTPTDVKTIAFKRVALFQVLGLIPAKIGDWITIIDILFIFRADRNCLHDDVAKTRVIKLPAPTH